MKLGATGNFPDGKLNANDEGELRMAIAADHRNNQIVVEFGKPVAWFILPPKIAVEFAKKILAKVDELGG